MITEKVDLYAYFGKIRPENGAGYLTVYAYDKTEGSPNRVRPAMLVIGGGGYSRVSQREKDCIAYTYLANGYVSFVLEYSVSPIRYPAQLNEGLMSMAYIRENAEKLSVDVNHVAAIGFSAGGHLCAMLASLSDSIDAKRFMGDKVSLTRPNAVVLSYPVISSVSKAHVGSFNNLCGDDERLKRELSLENRVTENSSPAFIWSTVTDESVPCENSIYYALACKRCGVPFELHVFAEGQHGLSLATEEMLIVNKPVQKWVEMSLTWLKGRGFEIRD